MKKWEQEKNKRQHEKKVQGAKSTLGSTNPNKTATSFASPNTKSQLSSHYSNISQSPQRSTQTDLSRVSHNSQISDYYEFEKQDLTSIPLYRLLKHYSLQQYAKALISRGYGYDLSKFATLARQDMDKLFSEINMIPGHKVKLMKLSSQVTQICHEIMEQDDLKQFKQNLYLRGTSADMKKPRTATIVTGNRSQSNPIKKKPATSAGEKKPTLAAARNNSSSTAKKPTSSSQKTKPGASGVKLAKTKKLEKIGFDFFSDSQQSLDDEFSKVLDSILDRYQDQFSQNVPFDGQPLLSKSRKEKSNHDLLMRINYSEAPQMQVKLKSAISDIDSKESSRQNDSPLKDFDETASGHPSDTRYYTNSPQDDTIQHASKITSDSKIKSNNKELNLSQVVQEKKTKEDNPAGVEARARILELIEKKVDANKLNPDELNVEFKKIKDMYSSFDGAKMTSTIANLDIEEMSYCLACAIQKHVDYFVEAIYPNGDFTMPVQKIEPKKEFNIQQLRYNYEQNLAKDDPNILSVTSGRVENNQAGGDQRFKLQGSEVKVEEYPEDNIVEEEECMEPEENGNLEGVEVHHKEEDDEVMHSESMGIGVIDYDEEDKLPDEEIEEAENVNFQIDDNMYKTNTPLDPYVTSQLEIISEKSYEASHNTVKLQQAFEQAREAGDDGIKQDIEENDREIEDFLRESLRDSILFNLKQDKQQDKKDEVVQNELENSGHSLKGFTMQIQPTEAGEYMGEAMDLRAQVMNDPRMANGAYMGGMGRSDLMSSTYENGSTSEVLYKKEKDWRELSMEESLYSELQWDNQNMDIADRIKHVFEKTYNERNITPDDYNKRIKHTVDKSSVQNYCKNIVITTKMEKEVVIICLVYIERLIVRTNMYLSAINWKRITFAALILASKIWDDESFENNNFARAFPQYTTKEINELEKVFLEFLDYNLMINASDYAKYYFILRTFAEKNKKSFPLKALNLQTVRQLQQKAATTSKSLKEIYADPLNKTFS